MIQEIYSRSGKSINISNTLVSPFCSMVYGMSFMVRPVAKHSFLSEL
jgi:hypothetical protein